MAANVQKTRGQHGLNARLINCGKTASSNKVIHGQMAFN